MGLIDLNFSLTRTTTPIFLRKKLTYNMSKQIFLYKFCVLFIGKDKLTTEQ